MLNQGEPVGLCSSASSHTHQGLERKDKATVVGMADNEEGHATFTCSSCS